MVIRMRTLALTVAGAVTLGACMTAPEAEVSSDVYPGVPVLSRAVMQIAITGAQDSCYGMSGTPQPCFVGVTEAGERLKFDDGIQGYSFQPGQAERIEVEKVTYDFTSPDAPMDAPSVLYVLVQRLN